MRGMVVVALLLLTACGDRLKWTEDVLLPDGRTVTLTRLQEFNGPPGEPFAPRTESYHRFEFTNPDTGKKVRWENDRDLTTVALSIDDKVPQLLTTLEFGGSVYRYNCPSPLYVAFQYTGSNWVQVPITQLARKIIRSNMTGSNFRMTRPYIEANKHHLSTQQVADHLPDKFRGKVIDLTPLDQHTVNTSKKCDPPFNYMTRDAGTNE